MDNVKLDELLSKYGNVLLSFEVKKLNNDDRYKFDSGYYRKMYKL